jgi:hypothetical protein
VMDGLRRLYTQIAALQLLPDAAAHMNFLMQLQAGVMKYIQMQAQSTIGGGQVGGPAGMGAPPGGPPGAANGAGAMPGQQIAPGGGAGMSGLAPQGGGAADDLRSLLAAQSGGG